MQKENKYAIFCYKQCDADLIEGLSNYIDENAHIIFQFFNMQCGDEEKVKIKIAPTKKEFDKLYIEEGDMPRNLHVPGWVIGTSIFEKRLIIYLSLHDYKNTSNPVKDESYDKALNLYNKTILHEYVHYVQGLYREQNNTKESITCFGEGIACYLSGQQPEENVEFDASCDELLSGKIGYDQYYLITKFLVENYDKNFVLKVLSNDKLARDFLQKELYDKASKFYNCNKEKGAK